MTTKSGYIRYSKRHVPRRKRRVYMAGAGTDDPDSGKQGDSNRWVRCWNCGFPIDLTPTVLGVDDSSESESVQVEDFDYSEQSRIMRGSDPYPGNRFDRPALSEGDYATPSLDTLNMVGTVIQLGIDGKADSFTYTPRQVTIIRGCPLCGNDNI
jgi:hypothetical protein